jgi:Bacteriophage capsid portal protein
MSEYVIGASVPEPENQEDQFKKQDPFNKAWEDLKNFSGLDSNFKRRSTRIAKTLDMPPTQNYLNSAMATPSGIDGAGSKEINPGDVFRNGYGLFDVITPPWNLYELANYYDTSFANHAAIDAKVENIVGLGYDFEVY